MSKRLRLITALFAVALMLVVAVVSRPHISHSAVQLFADSCSACGEYHEQVTGLIMLNPLRNRTPETQFLSDLKHGKCATQVIPAVCQQGLVNSRPLLDWKLRNRSDSNGQVSLFYVMKRKYRTGVDIYPQDAWGEGIVQVEDAGNEWNVSGYGAYY